MIFGYCRVSTEEQVLDRQLESLKKYNCDEIFMEKITGTKANRPELNKLKEKVREEDIVVIESLSRLGRSTKNLLELVEFLENKPNLKTRLNASMNGFKETREMYSLFNNLKSTKQLFYMYYVFANITADNHINWN